MVLTVGTPNHIVFGSNILGVVERPKYELGDARYLRPDWPHPIQIRPVVISDLISSIIYEPSFSMVIKRFRPGSYLRATVRLPEHLRENTAENADRAWRREIAKFPQLASAERLLTDEARTHKRAEKRRA